MVAALEMNPASAGLKPASWPPATSDKRGVMVTRTDSFETLCSREKIPFGAFVMFNFGIDIADPALRNRWPKVLNYYLRTLLKCTSLTPGGNYRFSGGETLYVPVAAAPPIVSRPREKKYDKQGLIEWFNTEMIPRRTEPAGTNIDRFRYFGEQSNPNGLCGAAANFVFDESPAMLDGVQVGFVLWQQGPLFTHIANIIVPTGFRVRRFERNSSNGVDDVTPDRYRTGSNDWPTVSQFTVLDLYFKKVQSLDAWWRSVAYLGSGTLTIDSTGQFMNDVD